MRQKVMTDTCQETYALGIHIKTKKFEWKVIPPDMYSKREKRVDSKTTKECLLVIGPGLGDYVITRNYIKLLHLSKKYKDYKLVLLCDEKIKDIAQSLDSDIIDKFFTHGESVVAVGKADYGQAERVRHHLIKSGLKKFYDTIIFFSTITLNKRLNIINDHILSGVSARNRIGCTYLVKKEDVRQSLHFTQIVPIYQEVTTIPISCVFNTFVGAITGERHDIQWPEIELSKIPANKECDGAYLVLQPVISSPTAREKIWHISNWTDLVLKLKNFFLGKIILVCTNNEKASVMRMQDELAFNGCKVDVKAGLPSSRLIALLKDAEVFIGHDSGLLHIAAALDTPSVCICSGRSFIRFLGMYEKKDAVRIVTPIGWLEWWKTLSRQEQSTWPSTSLPVNSITVDQVTESILPFLKHRVL